MEPDINPYFNKVKREHSRYIVDLAYHSATQIVSGLFHILTKFSKICLSPVAGSGSVEIKLAQEYPKVGFILIEKRFKRAYKAAKKSEKIGLDNLLVVRGAFEDFIELVSGFLFDCINVLFPDPWNKKRWERYRVYRRYMLEKSFSLLKKRGTILLKTDSPTVFAELLLNGAGAIYAIHFCLPYIEPKTSLRTDFEKLFLSRGFQIAFFKLTEKLPLPCI